MDEEKDATDHQLQADVLALQQREKDLEAVVTALMKIGTFPVEAVAITGFRDVALAALRLTELIAVAYAPRAKTNEPR